MAIFIVCVLYLNNLDIKHTCYLSNCYSQPKKMTQYEKILTDKIKNLIGNGITDFHEILKNCESADPRKVKELLDSVDLIEIQQRASEQTINYSTVGKNYLPAPDVSYSQWWFEETTIKHIVDKIKLNKGEKVLSIGTPTLAIKTSETLDTTLLDIDQDIISIFNNLKREKCIGIKYDIGDSLPEELKKSFDLALVDPPWYNNAIRFAINRAIQAVKTESLILFSFPGRLTRPGIEKSRSELIKELVSIGHDIVSIEHDNLSYTVPYFEENALKDISDFKSISWRKGDLIVFKKKSEKILKEKEKLITFKTKSFSRNPKEFRVFPTSNNSLSGGIPPQIIKEYSTNISTRSFKQKPDLWTTSKIGIQISDHELIEQILVLWQEGKSQE